MQWIPPGISASSLAWPKWLAAVGLTLPGVTRILPRLVLGPWQG